MALNHRKDEKIQIYYTDVVLEGTREQNIRHFIYNQDRFESGGLFANARTLTNTELTNGGLNIDRLTVKFTVNRNDKIATNCKVIYRGEVYDINTIDALDFRTKDMSFTAVRTGDTIKYSGDLFDE